MNLEGLDSWMFSFLSAVMALSMGAAKTARALVVGVLAHDAEEECGTQTAVHGRPRLSSVRCDVLETEEGLYGADQAVNTGLLEGFRELVAGCRVPSARVTLPPTCRCVSRASSRLSQSVHGKVVGRDFSTHCQSQYIRY
ncbi:hypothetical protein KCV03_g151, partial [Aureobasidium melanogenum]